jgi:hypothetical protein
MARTNEPAGWTSQFREIMLAIDARLHDLRGRVPNYQAALDPDDYMASQALGAQLRIVGSDGLVYPSVRFEGGECVGLFYPDRASNPIHGRNLDYHWDGARVDLFRDLGSGQVFRLA